MATLVRTFAPSFPSLFEGIFNEFEKVAPSYHQSLPSVNVIENENGYKLELAAPGLKKEDFKVNIHENILTISAEKTEQTEEKNEKYTRKEFNFSTFKRSFTLPKTVDSEKIVAGYTDGILSLEIPKKEEAKPKEPRLIEIA